ncbi:hypothetical protein Droror1_Dr00002920 [Drosera rotundifolia]
MPGIIPRSLMPVMIPRSLMPGPASNPAAPQPSMEKGTTPGPKKHSPLPSLFTPWPKSQMEWFPDILGQCPAPTMLLLGPVQQQCCPACSNAFPGLGSLSPAQSKEALCESPYVRDDDEEPAKKPTLQEILAIKVCFMHHNRILKRFTFMGKGERNHERNLHSLKDILASRGGNEKLWTAAGCSILGIMNCNSSLKGFLQLLEIKWEDRNHSIRRRRCPGCAGGELPGNYIAVFDPLDGSSNIDVVVSTGFIFGIYSPNDECIVDDSDDALSLEEQRCVVNVCQPGSNLLAAGYFMYSSSVIFVLTIGTGVYVFTLDPMYGELMLTQEKIKIPKSGKIYSFNEGNYQLWDVKLKKYIDDKLKKYSK